MSADPQTTAAAGDQWSRWRGLLQDVIDDMTFNVAPSKGTMDKIREAMQ